jgi:DAK2 domain fusion protein YloV
VWNPSLLRFRAVVQRALAALEARREEVNLLNVFPVADGDTGDNMALTLEAVLAELDRLVALGDVDDIGREEIVQSVARAALLGGRGNSGVILSQLIRGAAEELISRPGELVDPVLIGAAMARAAEQAYGSVREPAEGTILTVVREMSVRVASALAHMDEPRLTTEATAHEQDALIAEVLEQAVAAGEASVRRGPDLLPVLREAGVVDAGGYGLLVIFSGIVAALRGSDPPELEHHAPARVTRPQHASSTYRYCVNFAVTGVGLDARVFARELEAFGDSVLVVGDPATLKVHVHTDEPDAVTNLFGHVGTVSRLDVADMHEQVELRAERLQAGTATACCGALAVVAGRGVRGLFQSLGVVALEGGPTLNPSTYDLLAGIHAVAAEQVVVLPNSANVVMAAERAAELSEKEVRVVPTRSQQAGLAAAVALEPNRSAEENAAAMEATLEHVRTGGIAPAARDDGRGRFRAGDAVGYVEEELVAWGDPEATLRQVLARLGDGAELVTAIRGSGAPLDDTALAALAPSGVEVECSNGEQPSWWWLLSAE